MITSEVTLIGSPQPIVALTAGDDVILPCRLKPAIRDFSDTVEWTREDLDPEFVHVHQGGRLVVQEQNPQYKNRTVLFVDELKNGNVSLKLFRVTISDEGRYRCFIPSIGRGDFIQLHVGESRAPSLFEKLDELFHHAEIFPVTLIQEGLQKTNKQTNKQTKKHTEKQPNKVQ
uniref:Ig-like domain-containing protein n=1 Tax=Myripristis murdjan TaxID=586833 RepID=A0A667Z6B4_9TELE